MNPTCLSVRASSLQRAGKPALDIAAAGQAYDHEGGMLLQQRGNPRRGLVVGMRNIEQSAPAPIRDGKSMTTSEAAGSRIA